VYIKTKNEYVFDEEEELVFASWTRKHEICDNIVITKYKSRDWWPEATNFPLTSDQLHNNLKLKFTYS